MADELTEVVQIIRLSFDGIRLGLNVTGGTMKSAKNVTLFIAGLLNHEKVQGKTSLKNMLKRTGNLQVLQIKESDVKAFKKLASKYGILYSKIPDLNKADGMTEFVFPAESSARVNALIEKLGKGKIEDIVDYVNNADGNYQKTMEYLEKQNLLPKAAENLTSEREKELSTISKNIRYNQGINDLDKIDITISKNMVKSEDNKFFVTRVPGTYGDDVRYLKISKKDVITINNGKTFLTFLNKDSEYDLLDKDMNLAKKVKGEQLRDDHYDVVDDKVRERANRNTRKKKKDAKEKNDAKKKQSKKQNFNKKQVVNDSKKR